MKYGSLILEKKEYIYLKRILNISGYVDDHETQKCLMKLSEELKTVCIVDEKDMPNDVIRFNSIVKIVFNNGVEKTVQLVIPMDKDVKNNKISVLTSMGTALIGYSQDDSIIWDFPKGKQQITIIDVDQRKTYNGFDIVM